MLGHAGFWLGGRCSNNLLAAQKDSEQRSNLTRGKSCRRQRTIRGDAKIRNQPGHRCGGQSVLGERSDLNLRLRASTLAVAVALPLLLSACSSGSPQSSQSRLPRSTRRSRSSSTSTTAAPTTTSTPSTTTTSPRPPPTTSSPSTTSTTSASAISSLIPSGTYVDSIAGTSPTDSPHYFVLLTTGPNDSVAGTVNFEYQDGRTSVVFAFSGGLQGTSALTLRPTSVPQNGGSADEPPGAVPSMVSALIGSGSIRLEDCTSYLHFTRTVSDCSFRSGT